MSYDRNPPAPTRFLQDGTVVPPIPVVFLWPTIATAVTQATAVAANFVKND